MPHLKNGGPRSPFFVSAGGHNAGAFGLAEEIGSVEVGKRADLLLLAGNHPSCLPLRQK